MIYLVTSFFFVLTIIMIFCTFVNLKTEILSLCVLQDLYKKQSKEYIKDYLVKFTDKLTDVEMKIDKLLPEEEESEPKKDGRNEGLKKYWQEKREEKQRLLLINTKQRGVVEVQSESYPQT